jgi:lipoprotein-anchoring transpeptidase ErfK/SrfK
LAEVDKQRQLLFIVQEGKTVAVLNASTGDDREYEEPDANSPGVIIRGVALTPEGTFAIDRERPDGWWIGDLGQIYRPKYFIGGVAIHGSTSVPAYPASHGCVRVSVAAMDMIWDKNLLPRGTTVIVHSGVLA